MLTLRLVSVMAVGCCGLACGDDQMAEAPPKARALVLTRHAPDAYRRVCERQAREAPSAARACPPLVPAGPLEVLYRGRSLGRDSDGGGYSADFASSSLDRLDGRQVETSGGHWHYDAAWAPAVRRAVTVGITHPPNADAPSSCRDRRVSGEAMTACRVTPYEQGGGLHGGHIAYLWRHGDVTYVISLHGYANEPRARAMMAALSARIPRGAEGPARR